MIDHNAAPGRVSRQKRTLLAAVVAVIVALLLGASPVAAFTWDRTTLANVGGLALQDATFSGHDVAVVWHEPGGTTRLRTSNNAGTSFGSPRTITGTTRQATADSCAGKLYVADARDYSGTWLIDVTVLTSSNGYVGFSEVSAGPGDGRFPDVACAGGRLWVTWEQRVGGQWHVWVAQALRSSPLFGPGTDLGRMAANAGHPAIDAVGDRVYVAWPTFAGTVSLHRWSIGTGPGYAISDLGEQQLAAHGTIPRIAAQGGKVVLVWSDCGFIRTRSSANRGSSWSSTRTIFHGICGSEFGGVPIDVALHAPRTIVSYFYFAGFTDERQKMLSTTNDFATRTDVQVYPGSDLLLLGFVDVSGATRLAGAVDEGARLRFLRQP